MLWLIGCTTANDPGSNPSPTDPPSTGSTVSPSDPTTGSTPTPTTTTDPTDPTDPTAWPAGPRPLDLNPSCDLPVIPADAVDVTEHGAIPDDGVPDTAAFTDAIAAAGVGGTIVVPAGRFELDTAFVPWSGHYAFALLDGQTLSLDPDAVLTAVPNALPGSAMIYVDTVRDVTIAGGTLLGDRDDHLGTDGEWGMGIAAYGAGNLSIRRVRAEGFWGDGFYVGASYYGVLSVDVTVCGVEAVRNRRQGLSVTAVDGMVIEDSVFSDTEGTLPEGGIDLEPDNDTELVKDVVIRHDGFTGNRTGIYLTALSGVVQGPVDCVVEDNLIEDSRSDGLSLTRGTGNVVQRNVVRRSGDNGLLLKWSEPFVVTDNTIEDSAVRGMEIEAAEEWELGEPSAHTVTANRIVRSGAYGVAILWTHDVAFTDNAIADSGDAGLLLLVADRTGVERNAIDGSGGEGQIELDASSDATVRDNVVTLGAGDAAYGIWLHGSPTRDNLVEDNVLTGGYTDEAIRDDGQRTQITGNTTRTAGLRVGRR
ncbi:MAG: right-handed parallel beta-helix repeat-containing protein [Myxococcota bacterium]